MTDPAPLTQATDLLRHATTELTTIEPADPLDDLDPLVAVIGDARVVGLGEGAHFIEEFWTVRQRLIRFLHERLGFDVVAAEFDRTEGERLDTWLGDLDDARPLSAVSSGAADWGMAGTARWLRHRTRSSELRFIGLDVPNGAVAFQAALHDVASSLRSMDPDAARVLEDIETIARRLSGTSVAATDEWAALGAAGQDALTAGLARLRLRTRALAEHFASRTSRAEVTRVQRALDALAGADYATRAHHAMQHGGEAALDMSVRDRFMADSALQLLADRPSARVALLGHNAHIQKQPVMWDQQLSAISLGSYLRADLGADYVAVGTTTTGSRTSEMELDAERLVGFRVVEAQLGPPATGSIEAALVHAGLDRAATLTILAGTPSAAFSSIRAQSGSLTTPVSSAYDAVISLPDLTLQADLGF